MTTTASDAPPKKTRRRTFDEILYLRMDPHEAGQVRQIATAEGKKYSATVRKLIGLGLQTYRQQTESHALASS